MAGIELYHIKGVNVDGLQTKSANDGNIPFAPGLSLRRNIEDVYKPPPPLKDSSGNNNVNIDRIWDSHENKQWTLFVLALEAFKARPIEDKLSYFQVAGIHGYPQTPWDGAAPPPRDPEEGKDIPAGADPFGGYCQHNTISFPTWHRPYMLLYEQRIWEEMKLVIQDWTKEGRLDDAEVQKQWVDAANDWRLPYWDWAKRQQSGDKLSMPDVLCQQKVYIQPPELPNGKPRQPGEPPSQPILHFNPLWEFENPLKGPDDQPLTFGDVDMGQWRIKPDFVQPNLPERKARYAIDNRIRWDLTPRTGRYSIFLNQRRNRYIGHEGFNNYASANSTINDFRMSLDGQQINGERPGGNLADAVSRLFSPSYNAEWGTFASTKWKNENREEFKKKPSAALSLESVHNMVHNLAGGVDYATGMGHMSDVPVAAFDPIFWLHHCNIDRITAIWQVLHWDKWWDTTEPGKDNIEDAKPDDPLQPFHKKDFGDPIKDNSTVYTSNDVRDWTVLNYQYDDLVAPESVIKDGKLMVDEYIAEIQQRMDHLYPSTGKFVYKVWKAERSTPAGISNNDGTWNDYLVNVLYDRNALGGRPYTINFYIGSESDPQNIVGRVYTFSAGTSSEVGGGCENCSNQKKTGILSRAQIPLTIPLLQDALDKDISTINGLQRNAVVDYLKLNLHWKFVAYGGKELPASVFPKTEISVIKGHGFHDKVALPGDEGSFHMAAYNFDEYEYLYEVTKDKVGGAEGN